MTDRPVTSDRLSYAMVVAHPDDDAYGQRGRLPACRRPRFRFILIHATDGGAATSAPAFLLPESLSARVRMQEDEDAWRAVGSRPTAMRGWDWQMAKSRRSRSTS